MGNRMQVLENSEFGRLNVLIIEGKERFHATECARMLGYSNPHKAVRDHCLHPLKWAVPHPQNQNIKIQMTFIPESDLRRLIIRSKLPSAKRFEAWALKGCCENGCEVKGMEVQEEAMEDSTKSQEEIEMSNQVQVFENEQFGKVRTVIKNGEPWFVAVDVCRALEINNSRDAVSRLDKDEKNTVVLTDGNRGNPNVTIVNEPGLYSLVLGSRKPEAKAFKRWITHEVLPSIRKHGAYITPSTLEQIISNPDFGIRLLSELKQEREARVKAEAEKRVLETQNQELSLQNRILHGEILTWDFKALLNALIRSYASVQCGGLFNAAWKRFFKELYYKRSIGVENRRAAAARKDPSAYRKPLYSFIREDEESAAIQTAVAMCLDSHMDISRILKENVQDERVAG